MTLRKLLASMILFSLLALFLISLSTDAAHSNAIAAQAVAQNRSPAVTLTQSETYFVRLDAKAARVVHQLSPLTDLDYGTFRWLELTAADLARLQAAMPADVIQPADFTLRLGEVSFEPVAGSLRLPTGWDRVAHQGADLRLVQLIGPTQPAWLSRLEQAGLEIVQYIHPYTYVVWGETAALNRAQANNFVRWTGLFAPAYRVLPQWRNLPAAPIDVNILLYRGADTQQVTQRIAALGGKSRGQAILNRDVGKRWLHALGQPIQSSCPTCRGFIVSSLCPRMVAHAVR